MTEFTQEELERINRLYADDFEGANAADVKLISRYEAEKARREALYSVQVEEMKRETAERLDMARAEHGKAMEHFNLLIDKVVNHG